MASTLRLIDAGEVSWLRSQALYHGLAYARTDATPDTIVLATPATPYVSLGCHQDLEHEVDLDFCRRSGLPVLRRETGGGLVYLDDRQLFVQWVMAPARLPMRVDRRFAIFCEPLVATYRDLGVAADFRPLNDVHVRGRKISGTGAARIGEAEVLTGNFLFDFDTRVMAQVVRAPSAAFRAQVQRSLDLYMTSLRRELGTVPERAAVAAAYVRHCAASLGVALHAGTLTAAEERSVELAEQHLSDPAFVAGAGGLRRAGLKIHEDVYVNEATVMVAGAPTRATARLREGRITEIEFDGPSGPLRTLEAALAGVELAPQALQQVLAGLANPADAAALAQGLLDLGRARRGPVR